MHLLIEELVCRLGTAHSCPKANIIHSNAGNGGKEWQKQMDSAFVSKIYWKSTLELLGNWSISWRNTHTEEGLLK